MVAPETTACCGSWIVPEIEPVVIPWPNRNTLEDTSSTAVTAAAKCLLLILVSPPNEDRSRSAWMAASAEDTWAPKMRRALWVESAAARDGLRANWDKVRFCPGAR